MAIPMSLVTRLEKIHSEDVEQAAGRNVLQHRGEILSLVDLRRELGHEMPTERGELMMIVCTDERRRVGVLVDRILDIVEETITVRSGAPDGSILGAAVVLGKVTDMLDARGMIRRVDPAFAREQAA